MSDDTKMLAEYFYDGGNTAQPPSHLMLVALSLANRHSLGLIEQSAVLALTAFAMGDAGVAAWDSKLFWDYVRPITAIQCVYGNTPGLSSWAGPYLGVQPMNLSSWRPYQVPTALTPNFAEYVS